jgi:hypothetical protein
VQAHNDTGGVEKKIEQTKQQIGMLHNQNTHLCFCQAHLTIDKLSMSHGSTAVQAGGINRSIKAVEQQVERLEAQQGQQAETLAKFQQDISATLQEILAACQTTEGARTAAEEKRRAAEPEP